MADPADSEQSPWIRHLAQSTAGLALGQQEALVALATVLREAGLLPEAMEAASAFRGPGVMKLPLLTLWARIFRDMADGCVACNRLCCPRMTPGACIVCDGQILFCPLPPSAHVARVAHQPSGSYLYHHIAASRLYPSCSVATSSCPLIPVAAVSSVQPNIDISSASMYFLAPPCTLSLKSIVQLSSDNCRAVPPQR